MEVVQHKLCTESTSHDALSTSTELCIHCSDYVVTVLHSRRAPFECIVDNDIISNTMQLLLDLDRRSSVLRDLWIIYIKPENVSCMNPYMRVPAESIYACACCTRYLIAKQNVIVGSPV